MQGSLIAYRGCPAKIIAQIGNKFEILTHNQIIKVRIKDFIFLHPKYEQINPIPANLLISDKTLEILKNQSLSVEELAQRCYDTWNAQTAWWVYLLTRNRVYCYWNKGLIVIRPKQQVQQILTKQNQQQTERQQRQAFIRRLKQQKWSSDDQTYLDEIIAVALGQKKYSKTLTLLALENTPATAHQLLLDIQYWQADFNPYPQRQKYPEFKQKESPRQQSVERVDLTHLIAYAIDNADSIDADDAISIDGDRFWVHIADIATFILPNSLLDQQLSQMGSNLYLPEKTVSMLPNNLIRQVSLGQQKISNAISISFHLTAGEMNDIKVCYSKIRVQNISYDEVNHSLKTQADFIKLNSIAKQHAIWRKSQGSIQLKLTKTIIKYHNQQVSFIQETMNDARKMVAEWMVIAGRAIALFAIKHDIVLPFLSQAMSEINPKQIQPNMSPNQFFMLLSKMKHSTISTTAKQHSGLGLNAYIRFTSPMRRSLDLLAHQQLYLFLTKQPLLTHDEMKAKIKTNNTAMPRVNKILKDSQQHYRCLYFSQHSNWCGEAIVINYHKQIAHLYIQAFNISTQITTEKPLKPTQLVSITLSQVDLPNLSLVFKFT